MGKSGEDRNLFIIPDATSLPHRCGPSRIERMPTDSDEFYRISKLPPYVFAVINEMKAKARAAQLDVVDMGMGNPDGPSPHAVVRKLIEAVNNPRNTRY